MAKFALPIKSTYVPSWGPWEAIRELIQNAKDEEDANGHAMTVRHRGKLLTISNDGADMDRSVLLLGKTTKAGRPDLRGQFGEGLNLALLAAERSGLPVIIHTQTERWHARIEPAAEFGGEECLVIQTRKLQKRRSGVEVVITMSANDWEDLREKLLFLCSVPDDRVIRTDDGAILLEPERKGHLYAKGIFISKLDELSFGYDLNDCPLDRDRRMVNVWDLQWKIAQMYRDALAKRPELLQPAVYKMLRDNAEDTRQLGYHANMETAEGLLKNFHEEHGENAVPVASIAESQRLNHVNKRGVVVPETLRTILQKKTGTPDEIHQEGLRAISTTHAWSDLDAAEQALLTWTTAAIDRVSGNLRGDLGPLMSRLEIVDFLRDDILGVCDLEKQTIRVARKQLGDRERLLATLVHEEAHAISVADDGSTEHTRCIENLWTRLYFARDTTS